MPHQSWPVRAVLRTDVGRIFSTSKDSPTPSIAGLMCDTSTSCMEFDVRAGACSGLTHVQQSGYQLGVATSRGRESVVRVFQWGLDGQQLVGKWEVGTSVRTLKWGCRTEGVLSAWVRATDRPCRGTQLSVGWL